MKFNCQHCAQNLEGNDLWAAQMVNCPTCGASITVPDAAEPAGEELTPPSAPELPPRRFAAQPPRGAALPPQYPPARAPIQRRSFGPPAASSGYRPRPPKGGGSGFGKFLWVLFLLCACGFGYAMFHFDESPQQTWKRITDYVRSLTEPEAASPQNPAPTPAPTPVPSPTPELTPTPAPTATPIPPPDPLSWLLQHKNDWPKEVILSREVVFPAVFNGKVAGSATVPAGSRVQVVAIEPADVAVVYNGGGARVPIAETDLRQRAAAAMAEAQARTAAQSKVEAALTPSASPEATPGEVEDLIAERQSANTGAFVHPGLLHNEEDFKRMRTHKGRQPWKGGWERLIANRHASLGYQPRPVENVVRGQDRLATAPQNYTLLFNDVAAAYACALRWRISGERAYAEKSIQIMNAWSSTLKRLSGSTDVCLAAGIYGYEFANAGEIMRTYKGWKPEDFARFQKMMLEVFYPINDRFLEAHNGTRIDHYWANWDLCNMASTMAIGVLCDNRTIYEKAVHYAKHGKGMGAIKNAIYYVHPGGLGQWQESGRDQGHTTMGIGIMGAICEMAWKQGDDLYGYDDNRFLKGCEYVAKYNLGEDVPFKSYSNDKVTQDKISDGSRRANRPIWDLVYNHYVVLKGLSAPYTTKMAEKERPEGGGGDYGPSSGGFDQLGYGTLTATLDPQEIKNSFNAASSLDFFKKTSPAGAR